MKLRFASRLRQKVAAFTAVTLVGAGLMSGAAQADPNQYSGIVTVGSDTSQDVMAAMTGFTNGNFYTPLNSGAPNYTVVNSFEATGSTCITTKINGPTFNRSNGSSQGRRALSRAFDGANAGYGTADCGGLTDVTGFVDFARSSSGPSSGDTGTDLVYVPFGRDGVSFASYRADGGATTSLTSAQLQSLFTNTNQPVTIDGIPTYACGIQDGSGTFKFWNKALGITEAQEDAATSVCNNFIPGGSTNGRAQENDGDALKARGDVADTVTNGSQVIIGFSAGSFISKSNLVAAGAPPADVNIGTVDGIVPVNGTAPNLTPNSAFYASSTYGRDIYNVFDAAVINSLFGFTDIKNMFKGSSSAICTGGFATTVNAFGFQTPSNCGDTTLTGSYLTGNL